jgi:hypothetical protein
MKQRITAEGVVQGQLDAYNTHDLERFVAWYAESVLVYQAGKADVYWKQSDQPRASGGCGRVSY